MERFLKLFKIALIFKRFYKTLILVRRDSYFLKNFNTVP